MIYVFPFLVACSLLSFADLFNSELRPVEWPVQEARTLLDSSMDSKKCNHRSKDMALSKENLTAQKEQGGGQ